MLVGRDLRRRRRERVGLAFGSAELDGPQVRRGADGAAGDRARGLVDRRYGGRPLPGSQRRDWRRIDVVIMMRGDMAMHHCAAVVPRIAGLGRVQMQERRGGRTELQPETHEQDEAEPFHLSMIVSDMPERVKE